MLLSNALSWACLYGTASARNFKRDDISTISLKQPQGNSTADSYDATITFDDTCNESEKSVVVGAIRDAFMLARTVSALPDAGINNGPAFLDIFGPGASNRSSTIWPTFNMFSNQSTWDISASCDFSNTHSSCTAQYLQGEIGSEGNKELSPHFIFCKDFWTLMPLQFQTRRVQEHTEPTLIGYRFDLSYYSRNQGKSAFP